MDFDRSHWVFQTRDAAARMRHRSQEPFFVRGSYSLFETPKPIYRGTPISFPSWTLTPVSLGEKDKRWVSCERGTRGKDDSARSASYYTPLFWRVSRDSPHHSFGLALSLLSRVLFSPHLLLAFFSSFGDCLQLVLFRS